MFVVIGATGHTGSTVAEKLLAKGEKVRVVGRDERKLEPFRQKGGEAFVADATDSSAMERAFAGADAAYVMIPPNMAAPDVLAYDDRVIASLVPALQKSGVKQAVLLSSVGADKPDKTGPVVGLHRLEEKLESIPGLNLLSLRAGYFMENTLPQVGIIKNFGMMAGPVEAELSLNMIATRDIAAFAAEALLQLNFSGRQTRELLGQRDLNYLEAARIIGTAIGKPALAYIQLPAEQIVPAMTQMGMSKNSANLIVEMADALNSGYMKALEPRSPANTTPTSFERFVQDVFLPAFKGQATTA